MKFTLVFLMDFVRKGTNMAFWGLGRATGFCNPGLTISQTSEEVYPLYSAYNNSKIKSYPHHSYKPLPPTPLTNHYATADIIHFKENTHLRSKASGI